MFEEALPPNSSFHVRLRQDPDDVSCHGIRLSCLDDAQNIFEEAPMTFTVSDISPAVALLAGILILIVPRALNYIVAIYLIIVGLLGLGALKLLS